MVLLHQILGRMVIHYPWVGHFVKGRVISLYEDGRYNVSNMRQTQISEHDLLEGIRETTHHRNLDQIEEVFIERSGQLSVIMKSKAK